MFERYTERARQVIVLAQDSARSLKHNYIGSEHILVGLLREEEGLAARVLDSLDVTVDGVEKQVARIVGQGDTTPPDATLIPFTPRAKNILDLALREALSLGHNYIGTEHILLGLVRENEGVAARILLDFDVTAETVRNEIIHMLSGPNRRKGLVDKVQELADSLRGDTEPIRISISKPGRDNPDKAAAVLPNGKTAENVYQAYSEGYTQGFHDAGSCPACGKQRVKHEIEDIWSCIDTLQKDLEKS